MKCSFEFELCFGFTWLCTQFNNFFVSIFMPTNRTGTVFVSSILVHCFAAAVSLFSVSTYRTSIIFISFACSYLIWSFLLNWSNTRWKHVTTYTLCRKRIDGNKYRRYRKQRMWLLTKSCDQAHENCLALDL